MEQVEGLKAAAKHLQARYAEYVAAVKLCRTNGQSDTAEALERVATEIASLAGDLFGMASDEMKKARPRTLPAEAVRTDAEINGIWREANRMAGEIDEAVRAHTAAWTTD